MWFQLPLLVIPNARCGEVFKSFSSSAQYHNKRTLPKEPYQLGRIPGVGMSQSHRFSTTLQSELSHGQLTLIFTHPHARARTRKSTPD